MPNTIEIHGHRGARGSFPENTIRSFLFAIECDVSAVEMDIVISSDNKIVVSHEPWFNPPTCTNPLGKEISGKNQGNFYQMSYDEIRRFDCGKKGNPDFPDQKLMVAHKPLLSEAIEACEDFIKKKKLNPITYNIEIKSEREWYGKFQPFPEKYIDLVLRELETLNVSEKCMLQSFDPNILNAINSMNKKITTGLLVENIATLKENLRNLNFVPAYYNPFFELINEKLVKDIHIAGMKILAWTVNSKEDMIRIASLGVNGIITDYPEIAVQIIK